jgi:ABC-type branched-subunit amino acid transport system substrate-binding protein
MPLLKIDEKQTGFRRFQEIPERVEVKVAQVIRYGKRGIVIGPYESRFSAAVRNIDAFARFVAFIGNVTGHKKGVAVFY